MVTHEDDIAACAKRIIRMRDGLIIDDGPSARAKAAQAALVGTTGIKPTANSGKPISSAVEPELRSSNEELTH